MYELGPRLLYVVVTSSMQIYSARLW